MTSLGLNLEGVGALKLSQPHLCQSVLACVATMASNVVHTPAMVLDLSFVTPIPRLLTNYSTKTL